jgi:hypothetical protein
VRAQKGKGSEPEIGHVRRSCSALRFRLLRVAAFTFTGGGDPVGSAVEAPRSAEL